MIDSDHLLQQNRELAQLAGEKFSFRGTDLARAMRKVGRRLPARAHESAAILIRAETMAAHPKLARMLVPQDIKRARADLSSALKSIDPADRRKGLILSTLGMVVFNLLAVAVLVLVILNWRGFL